MNEIKFIRVFFYDKEKTKFSHISFWGIIEENIFVSPSTNNYALYFTDLQFTGRKDKNGKECYIDDIVKYKVSIVTNNNEIGEEELIDRVSFDIGQSSIFPLVMTNEFEIIGNFYQNKNLIKS